MEKELNKWEMVIRHASTLEDVEDILRIKEECYWLSVENGINNPKLREEPAIPRCCWSLLHGKAGRSRQGHIHQLVGRTEEPNPNQQGCHMQPCCWDRSHQYIKIEKEFDVPELGREWSEKRKDQAVFE